MHGEHVLFLFLVVAIAKCQRAMRSETEALQYRKQCPCKWCDKECSSALQYQIKFVKETLCQSKPFAIPKTKLAKQNFA